MNPATNETTDLIGLAAIVRFTYSVLPDECNRRSINILNIFISFASILFICQVQSVVREENTADHTKDMQIDSNVLISVLNLKTGKMQGKNLFITGQTQRIDRKFP